VFPTVVGVPVLLGLCYGGLRYAKNPKWLAGNHALWARLLLPGQNWTVGITLVLIAAGLIGFWWPRRHDQVHILLLSVAVMVLVAAPLGTFSYLPCHGPMSMFGVMFWVLQLFVGQPPNVYQPPYTGVVGQVCSQAPPPALQIAQIVGLGATLIGFVALGMVLWREPVQRLQSRFTPRATVFTGLNTLSLPVLRELTATARKQRRNPRNIVVIEPDESNQLLDEARASGARVVMGDPTSRALLRPIIAGWGRRSALDLLYALSDRVPENEAVLKTAGEILRSYEPAADRQTHLIARIDDPRHAAAWRGGHVRTDGRWFEDALSTAEVTAHSLLAHVLAALPRRLVICGDSNLTVAILAELARRSWERQMLIEAAEDGRANGSPEACEHSAGPAAFGPLLPERIVLLDIRADAVKREYEASVSHMILDAAPAVETDVRRWHDNLLRKLDDMSPVERRQTAVIIVDGPDESHAHEAGRVARLHQKTLIFTLSASGAGMRDAIFERLHPFELGLQMDGGVPADFWTQIARLWHERYRLSHPVLPDDPKEAKRRPWDSLAEVWQRGNILQVRSILKLVAESGRTWVPIRMVPSGSHVELNASEIDDVARLEHARWLSQQGQKDRADNANARPWNELDEAARDWSRREVVKQLEQLAAVGFLPTIPPGGPDGAKDFERTGVVNARRLTSRVPWRPRGGEVLHGNPGDWYVEDAAGNVRTVADPEFQVSHEDLGNGKWRRIGTFRAWKVAEDQVVRTKEGRQTAKAGGWIVEGIGGDRWPVNDDAQFRRTYRRVADALPHHDQASTPVATSNSTAAANST
jgi:hypothetical protein